MDTAAVWLLTQLFFSSGMKKKKNQSQPRVYLEVAGLVKSAVCLQMFSSRVDACLDVY